MKKLQLFISKLIIKAKKLRGRDKTIAENDSKNYESDNVNINDIVAKDFQLMLKFGKPSNVIGKYQSKPFIELPYGIIKKDLKAYQKQELISESIELLMQNQFEDFKISKASANEVIGFLLWIKSQQEFIKNIEEQNLHSEPEPEMLAAGIHRLNEFGIATTVEKIAKDWNMIPEEVEAKPYFKIYEKMKMDKIQGEINKAYQKILEAKSKRK